MGRHLGSRGLGEDAQISSKPTKNGLRVVKRHTDGGAVETTPVKSSGKRVSGDFLSVQHLVAAVSSVLSVWETEARRDQLSVLHQPNRNQNQRALERVVVTDEADGWISL